MLEKSTDEIQYGMDMFSSTVARLKHTTKMKENFIAGMIHDIRNPLSSMICSLDYIKENEKIQDDEDLGNMLEIASHCAEFIISHVGNFLDISKLQNSKLELCPTPTEVKELLKKIVFMHKFKAENKQLFLKMNATDNIPDLALIDNGRFTQVMVNLISNALKFTSNGGVTINIYFKDTQSPMRASLLSQDTPPPSQNSPKDSSKSMLDVVQSRLIVQRNARPKSTFTLMEQIVEEQKREESSEEDKGVRSQSCEVLETEVSTEQKRAHLIPLVFFSGQCNASRSIGKHADEEEEIPIVIVNKRPVPLKIKLSTMYALLIICLDKRYRIKRTRISSRSS